MEPSQLAWRQRRRARQGDRERVAVFATDTEFVMKMRPGGDAGGADVADDVALDNPGTLANACGKARQVAIDRLVAALMPQDDHVAIAALATGKLDHGIAGGLDPGSGRRAIVDALVGADFLEHGVEARGAETGSDPGKLEWRAQECLAQAFAVRVVCGETGGLSSAINSRSGLRKQMRLNGG